MTYYVMVPLAPESIEDPEAIAWAENEARKRVSGDITGVWQHFDRKTLSWKEGLEPNAFQFRYLAHNGEEPR